MNESEAVSRNIKNNINNRSAQRILSKREPDRKRCGVIFRTQAAKKDQRKHLIVKEIGPPGYWGFPKGSQEQLNRHQVETQHAEPIWETLQETAIRELKEETGIVLSKEQLDQAPMITVCPKPSSRKRQYNYFIVDVEHEFACQIDPLEISDYQWSSLQELKQLATSSFTKQAINKLYSMA